MISRNTLIAFRKNIFTVTELAFVTCFNLPKSGEGAYYSEYSINIEMLCSMVNVKYVRLYTYRWRRSCCANIVYFSPMLPWNVTSVDGPFSSYHSIMLDTFNMFIAVKKHFRKIFSGMHGIEVLLTVKVM